MNTQLPPAARRHVSPHHVTSVSSSPLQTPPHNIYIRGGHRQSLTDETRFVEVASSPKRPGLLSRFTRGPKSPLSSTDTESAQGTPPRRQTPTEDASPKGLLDTFRPRSKSESKRNADSSKGNQLTTIYSVDESEANSPTKQPLFVDTFLANRGAGVRGSGRSSKSPVASVMDRLFTARERRRSHSGGLSGGLGGSIIPEDYKVRFRRGQGPLSADCVLGRRGSANADVLSGSGDESRLRRAWLSSYGSPMAGGSLHSSIDGVASRVVHPFFLGSDVGALAASSVEDENTVYAQFLRIHRCYDLIPTSTKIVTFDVQLLVRKAFFALVYNGVRAAPLWDSKRRCYVGMLTITDFIKILSTHTDQHLKKAIEIEDQKISAWKGDDGRFVSINSEDSLYNAIKVLVEQKVHRLPVINHATGNVLYILTHKRILRFLSLYLQDLPHPSYMNKTPRQLGIGAWNNLLTIHPDSQLSDVLDLFMSHRVSALPVVDRQTGRITDIYAKFDVINLAADKAYSDLHITVTQALAYRQEWFEGVHCVKENDDLLTVIETLVKSEVHRIVVTDNDERLVGVLSLSDILRYLVIDCVRLKEEDEDVEDEDAFQMETDAS